MRYLTSFPTTEQLPFEVERLTIAFGPLSLWDKWGVNDGEERFHIQYDTKRPKYVVQALDGRGSEEQTTRSASAGASPRIVCFGMWFDDRGKQQCPR